MQEVKDLLVAVFPKVIANLIRRYFVTECVFILKGTETKVYDLGELAPCAPLERILNIPKLPGYSGQSALSHKGKIYTFGGLCHSKGWTVTNACASFNWNTGEWKELPPMLSRRYLHTSQVVGEKFYIIGGAKDYPARKLQTGEIFDLNTQKWHPFPKSSHFTHLDHGSCVVPIRSKSHSQSKRKSRESDIPSHRIYVIGENAFNHLNHNCEFYDCEERKWHIIEPLPSDFSESCGHRAVFLESKIYVYNGIRSLLIYDCDTDKWSSAPCTPLSLGVGRATIARSHNQGEDKGYEGEMDREGNNLIHLFGPKGGCTYDPKLGIYTPNSLAAPVEAAHCTVSFPI